MRRLFRHSVRHRVYEIGARTRAHENRLERAGSTTWCGTHTSEAADGLCDANAQFANTASPRMQ